MRKHLIGILASTMFSSIATPALAQAVDDPVFRVPFESSGPSAPIDPVWIWAENVGACSSSCGTGTRETTYQCQDASNYDFTSGGYGPAEPASQCTSAIGAAPVSSSASCTNYSGCEYDWVRPPETVTVHPVDENPPGRPGCGKVQRQFDPRCERGDGTVLADEDHAFCRSDLPDYNDVAAGSQGALGYDRTEVETDQCNVTDHEWRTGDWSAPSSTCSDSAVFTRSVTCYRRFDNSVQADTACDAATRPSSSKVEGVYSSCSWTAQFSPWGAWSSNCSSTASRTRTVKCLRSDGSYVSLAACTAKGVSVTPTTETQARYGGCTYSRVDPSAWTAWSSTCQADATRTRTYDCRRSDGTIVADSECTSRGISLTETATQDVYSGCSYSWNQGSWSTWSSSCSSSATRTRSVTCRRSNGDTVADSYCTTTKPATSEVSGQYSGCSYAAANWTVYGSWSSTCSSSATRTRTADCRRSDGTIVADSNCTNRGIALSQTETQAIYSGCSYAAANWTSYSAWSSTCSANATRTRTADCRRSDGTIVADTECTSRGIALSQTDTQAVYSGCSYSWITGSWSAWSSTCSSSATRNRSVVCRRSNGANVADSYCTTTKPASSDTAGVYSSCTYAAANWTPYSSWSSTCSSSATRTRTADCRRSDGTIVADSNCTNRGIALSQTDTQAVYSGCSYSWVTGSWSSWSSTCSSSATRTRSVVCRRSNGANVADSYCTTAKPATSDTGGVYSSCTYAAANWTAYSAWSSTCSANATRTRTADCRRSDGTIVADSYCTTRGIALSQTDTQAVYSGCSYAWVSSSWSAWSSTCSSSASRTRTVRCRRSDGTYVADGYCTTTKPATSDTGAVYSGCGYSWVTGAWSAWSSTCSSNATRTRSVRCRRSDGAYVTDGYCTTAKPAGTDSGAVYSGCSYSASYGSWSSCSGGTQSRSITCTRSDGVKVASSYCGFSGSPTTQTQDCAPTFNSAYCNSAMDVAPASVGSPWTINRPLGAYNGTSDYTTGIEAYMDKMLGAGKWDSTSWTAGTDASGWYCQGSVGGMTPCTARVNSSGQVTSGYCTAYW